MNSQSVIACTGPARSRPNPIIERRGRYNVSLAEKILTFILVAARRGRVSFLKGVFS